MIRKLADEWDDEDEDTEHETLNEIIPKVDKEVRNDISTPSGENDDLVRTSVDNFTPWELEI